MVGGEDTIACEKRRCRVAGSVRRLDQTRKTCVGRMLEFARELANDKGND